MISVREIRIASGKLGVCAVATCTCTASYSVKSSDKATKSASVQEANVTAMVNGMQRYLEFPICEGEEKENNPAPINVKNQLTITSFAVATARYSHVPRARSPIRSSPVKRIAKIPVYRT